MQIIRRHLSYANVAATLALVFAMSSGALAANRYLINSSKQINPNVLKKIKGAAGKTGVAGKKGASGAVGAGGPTGAVGAGGAAGQEGVPGKEGSAGREGTPGKNGATGEVGATGPSNGYQASKEAVGLLASSLTSVGTLTVPAGSYLATAKLWVTNEDTVREKVTCTLGNNENGDSDASQATLEPIGSTTFLGRAVVTLEAASTLAAEGHWLVSCSGSSTLLKGEDLKIQALRVGSLTSSSA